MRVYARATTNHLSILPVIFFFYIHSLLFPQELRGNVRVFARVRPFLPSDGVGPDEAPAVVGKGDGVGCVVSKRMVGDNGKELPPEGQSFSFDKCFPPRSVWRGGGRRGWDVEDSLAVVGAFPLARCCFFVSWLRGRRQ